MEAWLTTFTGKTIDVCRIQPDDIDILDIAHHLACINRFNGALKTPVNVAHHSVCVAQLCDGQECELQALLHDAAEAYVGDMTKWLKSRDEMYFFRTIEDRVHRMIMEKYHCDAQLHDSVLEADKLMVRFEAGYHGSQLGGWKIPHPQYPELTHNDYRRVGYWAPMEWYVAEQLFLGRFHTLTQ